MTNEEITKLVQNQVKIELKKAKEDLAKKIERNLRYTGEFAGARRIIDAVNLWSIS